MNIGKYIIRRVIQIIPVIIFVIIFNFLLINFAPGDPATVLAGEDATQEYIDELRIEYGLDKPLHTRLAIYVGELAKGDLGESYTYKEPVTGVVMEKLKFTLMLILLSESITIIIGTLLGAWAARNEGNLLDNSISNISMVLYSLPVFWIGMILMLFFAVKLQWLPSSGVSSLGSSTDSKFIDTAKHLTLPAATLILHQIPIYIKITRSSVVEKAKEDYIKTARAIGYSEKVVYRKHALR